MPERFVCKLPIFFHLGAHTYITAVIELQYCGVFILQLSCIYEQETFSLSCLISECGSFEEFHRICNSRPNEGE